MNLTSLRRMLLFVLVFFMAYWVSSKWIDPNPPQGWALVLAGLAVGIIWLGWAEIRARLLSASLTELNGAETPQSLKKRLGEHLPLASTTHPKSLAPHAIRVFASLDDARQYGWVFDEQVGMFDGHPVYRWATFQGKTWMFDGLAPQMFSPVVADSIRLFGRLKYKEYDELAVDHSVSDFPRENTMRASHSESEPTTKTYPHVPSR